MCTDRCAHQHPDGRAARLSRLPLLNLIVGIAWRVASWARAHRRKTLPTSSAVNIMPPSCSRRHGRFASDSLTSTPATLPLPRLLSLFSPSALTHVGFPCAWRYLPDVDSRIADRVPEAALPLPPHGPRQPPVAALLGLHQQVLRQSVTAGPAHVRYCGYCGRRIMMPSAAQPPSPTRTDGPTSTSLHCKTASLDCRRASRCTRLALPPETAADWPGSSARRVHVVLLII